MSWLYRPARAITRFCFDVFGRMEVIGKECVPPYGPLIVVANHISYNDPPAVAAALSRRLCFIGKQELFASPVKRLLFNALSVYPVDRSSGTGALRTALNLLAQDRAVVIFPEGHVSRSGAMEPGLAGAAYLAMRSQAPILPIGVTGTEKFPPWRLGLPFSHFQVNIGQPFTPPVLEGRHTRDAANSVLEMIMRRIAAQLPQEYRGVYGFSPVGESRDTGGS